MPLFSNTTASLIERVARKLSDWKEGTNTGTANSTFVDTTRDEPNDYFENTVPPSKVHIISTTDGLAPQGETRTISDWVLSTGTGTLASNWTAVLTSGDTYCIQSLYTWEEILQAINEAIDSVKAKVVIAKIDHTIQLATSTYEYDVPAGFTHIYRISMEDSVGNYPEAIPPDNYKLIRGTPTPRIHFIRYPNEQLYSAHYIGGLWADSSDSTTTTGNMTDGRLLRVEGFGYQDALVKATDMCYLNPAYIVNQATALVLGQHITRSDTDPDAYQTRVQYYQGLANAELPSSMVRFPPNTKRIYL